MMSIGSGSVAGIPFSVIMASVLLLASGASPQVHGWAADVCAVGINHGMSFVSELSIRRFAVIVCAARGAAGASTESVAQELTLVSGGRLGYVNNRAENR